MHREPLQPLFLHAGGSSGFTKRLPCLRDDLELRPRRESTPPAWSLMVKADLSLFVASVENTRFSVGDVDESGGGTLADRLQ